MDSRDDLQCNQLLAALPEADRALVLPLLEWVELPLGHVLYESGMPLTHAHFPTSGIVALLYVMEDGATAEIALVGREGLVGVSLLTGGGSTPSRAVVQSAGGAFRMRAADIRQAFNHSAPVMHLLLRYTQALITQMSQTAACNRHHTVEQQLARILLMSLDRLPASEVRMTHELIARMLGVRREGVTQAALRLQKLGVIHCSRGLIAVLDRPGLEQHSCECYAVVKHEYDRLLPIRLGE